MSEGEGRRAALASALEWLLATLPQTEYDAEGWRLWADLNPHLDSVVEASEALGVEWQPLAWICGAYGIWHYLQARSHKGWLSISPNTGCESNGYVHSYVKTSSFICNSNEAFNLVEKGEPAARDLPTGSPIPAIALICVNLRNLWTSFIGNVNRPWFGLNRRPEPGRPKGLAG